MKKILLCAAVVIGVVMGVTLPSTHASSKNAKIVIQQTTLNHSGSLSSNVVFTPTAEGDFRVSVYASGPSDLSNTGTIAVDWTDENASRTFAPSVVTPIVSLTQVVHSAANQGIQVRFLTTATFDLYVTVEEL